MNRILSLIGVVLVVGCGPEPRDLETLQELRGVYMNPVDGQPYSGPVFETRGDVKVMTSSLKDGEFDGEWVEYSYFGDGQLEEMTTYTVMEDRERTRDGPWKIYYEDGQLSGRSIFKDGELDGPYESHYRDGQLESKGSYSNGEFDGLWESYHENGGLLRKGTYKDGERCGEWLDFSETVTYDPC